MDWSGFTNGLGETLASVMSFIFQLIVFAVIMLIGWLIAKGISRGLTFLFGKIGLQRLLDRSGISRLVAPMGIDPLDLIVKLVYYFILLITLQLALSAFGPSNPVSEIVNDIVAFLPSLFVAAIIVIVVAAIANVVGDLVAPALARYAFGDILRRIIVVAIVALGVIAALNQIGIAVSVTMPLLIAVLAAIVGVVIVGFGGGLIGPMRDRWERWIGALEEASAKPAPAAAAPQQPQTPPQRPVPPQAPADGQAPQQ